MSYQQLRFYSPILDAECVRFSMFGSRGSEYFVVVPVAPAGEPRRQAREDALDALTAAMDSATEPGEVHL